MDLKIVTVNGEFGDAEYDAVANGWKVELY